MITTLGYEELKRLHAERVNRSLRRYQARQAATQTGANDSPIPATEPCLVIDLPERRDPVHKLGA